MTCRHTGNDPNCSAHRGPYGDVDTYEKAGRPPVSSMRAR